MMNNFRHNPSKNSFGVRGTQQNSDLSNPWVTEEDLCNMRRQNTQFNPVMSSMTSNMQTPSLNQNYVFSAQNKSYLNESSCKIPGSNFSHSSNLDMFKSLPSVNESNYQNRCSGDRFSGNSSFSDVNMQYKLNDRSSFNDFSGVNATPIHIRKTDAFSENISKSFYSNMRQPQERFHCIQNDQSQFSSKFSKPQMSHSKGFPFNNDKVAVSSNSLQYIDKISNPAGSSFSSKTSYKAPNLFPAYSQRDVVSEENISSAAQHTTYASNFVEKSSSFCDRTQVSSSYSRPLQCFEEKCQQDRNLEKALDELFKIDAQIKNSLKDLPNSQTSHCSSFKSPVETSFVNNKFSFSTDTQQPCFQSASGIPFQTSDGMQITNDSNTSTTDCLIQTSHSMELSNYPNSSSEDCLLQTTQNVELSDHSSSSKDCLLQNASHSVQTGIHQNLKEGNPSSNCSFNFESNISAPDIVDLLPGIDAYLKESVTKSEEFLKSDGNKSLDNTFASCDIWSKPSIPFIGDNQASSKNDIIIDNKNNYCNKANDLLKEKYTDKLESRFEKTVDTKLSDIDEGKLLVGQNQSVSMVKDFKVHSALEEAIDLLVTNDAIVGLDFIVEYKKNINQKGSFPFKCKLCNSAISRPSIIDHIIGSKHRMRYLKSKDESKYEQLIGLKIEKSEKDAKIFEAVQELENIYGRGHVIVDVEDCEKKNVADSSLNKIDHQPVDVFTLDKIPIGFEALSPEHDDVHSPSFALDSNLNQESLSQEVRQSNDMSKISKDQELFISEPKKEFSDEIPSECRLTLPGFGLESYNSGKSGLSSILSQAEINMDTSKDCEEKKDVSLISVPQNVQTSVSPQVKRCANVDSFAPFKQQKVNEAADSSITYKDSVDEVKSPKIKPELFESKEKNFSSDLLEELSKCIISSEEEASFALKAVNILIQMLLRYKLQHVSFEVLENMMRSLQSRSPDKIEELLSLLKDSKIQEEIEDSKKSVNLQLEDSHESNDVRNISHENENHIENCTQNLQESNLISNINCDTTALSSNIIGSPSTFSSANAVNLMAPQMHVTASVIDNHIMPNTVRNATDPAINIQTAAVGSHISGQVCLKPPPFFNWSQTNENLTSATPHATVQGNQGVMWNASYQPTQTQFTKMPFYQAQGYGSTFSGTQAYQSQFPVVPQSSVPLKITTPPPLPPPPPPLPSAPAPSNPPLPPLPSPAYPSVSSSHSVPLHSNSLSHLPPFSNPPPPPPPPLP